MIRLLAKTNGEMLAQLAWSRILLGFDFDGTLAPIVADRDRAVMRDDTAALFAAVCRRYPCAVISGRSKADVAERLAGCTVKYVIGNHGLEPGADLGEFEREMRDAVRTLSSTLSHLGGVDLEDKRYSVAIHYRRSRAKRATRTAILHAVDQLGTPMRVVPGKLVINVIPKRAPNKGDALLGLRTVEGANTAFYIGDDVTDEDVFRIDQPGRLLSVRVGESRGSAAKYFLRDQREMDVLLRKLVALRPDEAPR